ncbi:MAG: hypothetical protein KAJ19_05200, partial [Gammaproteobacteria bacterium]|nr:hypothetical protein [Gammaproteobacteria bacterium]
MNINDIAKTVADIAGMGELDESQKKEVVGDVQFLIDNPTVTPVAFHKRVDPETPWKKVKTKQKEKYKTIIATVKSLSALKSDEKGDFVECKEVKVGSTS